MEHLVEFSRPLNADKIGNKITTLQYEATKDELALLALRFDLISLEKIEVSLKIKRIEENEVIEAVGNLFAVGAQKCVITLKPVTFDIKQPIFWNFTNKNEGDYQIDFDIDSAEPDEIIEDNQIDLGELAVQQLADLLDPYPRVPGAKIPPDGLWFGSKETNSSENKPFAALCRLKQ